MTIYRITNSHYSHDLSGNGAKINGSRWNSKDVVMLYTSAHISLAVLEMLVHTNFKDYSIPLDLVSIHIPDTAPSMEISLPKLKKNWLDDLEYTRYMGDEFIRAKDALVLKVPSAVIREEHNLLVNPLHADFKKIKITATTSFRTDKRLFVL